MEDITRDFEFVQRNTVDTIKNTVIRKSNIHGFGLFATKPIGKDSILCVLDGQVLKEVEYQKLIKNIAPMVSKFKNYFFMECNKLDLKNYLVRGYRTKYSYINHSFEANAKIIKFPLRIITLKNIESGQEILIDYTQEELSLEYLEKDEKKFLRK